MNFGTREKPESFSVGPAVTFRMSRQLQHILQLPSPVIDNSVNTKAVIIAPPITIDLDVVSLYQRNIFVTCDNIEPVFANNK